MVKKQTQIMSRIKLVYRSAVFIGAFLLFQIQPMISKAILPLFGGSYLVWAACMVFFQVVLLFGYAYVHGIQYLLGVGKYSRWHWVVLAVPLLTFSFSSFYIVKGAVGTPPLIAILRILFLNIGLPFFALSTISLIIQSWWSLSSGPESKSPYFLYSASNLGSMMGLLTYPVIFEPMFTLTQQLYIWRCSYVILIILCFSCMPKRESIQQVKKSVRQKITESPRRIFSWFVLSMAACSMLLSVTNLLTFDLAAVPLLWVVPLSIYLLTFVLTFKQKSWFPKWAEVAFMCVAPLGILFYLFGLRHAALHPVVQLVLQLFLFFIICLNCNGNLIRIKPANVENLTLFYLVIALGGFVGSFFVSAIIPLLSASLIEYPISILFAFCAVALAREDKTRMLQVSFKEFVLRLIVTVTILTIAPPLLYRHLHISAGLTFLVVALPSLFFLMKAAKKPWSVVVVVFVVTFSLQWAQNLAQDSAVVKRLRNFYGIYTVYDLNGQRHLQHGTTLHGRQYLDARKAHLPLSVFHATTPIGGFFLKTPFTFDRVGVVGLGAGALASYVESGKSLVIYELDPDGLPVAEDYFSYLKLARQRGVDLEFVFGDGRISLGQVEDNSFDLLIIDVFNSGSIPVHMLTLEAIHEYMRVLKPDGVLVINVSNWALDLPSVLCRAARELDIYLCVKTKRRDVHPDAEPSVWSVLTRDRDKFKFLIEKLNWKSCYNQKKIIARPWTDQHSNLLGALR
ncbi:spermidine synthase [Thermoproteota archaeon]